MRRFLLHATLFGSLALLGIMGYVLKDRHFLPAPCVTGNEALNMKLSHLRHRGRIPAHVLAVGSSMAMNNLCSDAVMAHFGDTSFVNMGAWGLDMVQTAALTKVLVPVLRPHTVLLVSNLSDLLEDGKGFPVDTARVRKYLVKWSTLESYLRNLEPVYYLREMERNKIRMFDRGNYEFMGMDGHGWAALMVPQYRRDPDRWNSTPPDAHLLAESHYAALQRLSGYLKEQGVRLVFVQTPYRDGVRTPAVDRGVAEHLARVARILAPHGHQVVSATDRHWPDSLFADYSHLNSDGTETFTSYVLAKLEPPQGLAQ